MTKLKAKDPKQAEPSKPKILLFGKPGVGKTWWALDFPRVYYIDTEGGADLAHYTDKLKKSGGVYMGPDDGTQDFKVVVDEFKALATEPHDYNTVVVDSITKLYNVAIAMEAEKLGEKNAFGADKKPAIAGMRRLLNWVSKLDMNVIFIAHEKDEWGQTNGERTQIGQTFDGWDKLEYELHLALRAFKAGESRSAKVRKSRMLGFPDGETFPLTYQEFATRYGKDIIEKKATAITLASLEQVKEVLKLLEVVKIDDDEIVKWFNKAGAEKWEDFTAEQIDKCITHLKGKVK